MVASKPKNIHSKRPILSQMGDDFQTLLWSSFKKIYGPILAASSIIVAFLVWIFEPTQSLSLKFAIPSYLIILMIICVLTDATYANFEASKKAPLPSIKQANKNEDGNILCLLSPSELFSQDMLVSFYYRDGNSMERLIGVGHIEIIQEDKQIQAVLLVYEHPYKSILDQLAENDENIKEKVRVKPGTSRYYIDRLYNRYTDFD